MSIKVLHVVGAMNMGGTETMLMNVFRNIDHTQVEFHFISFSKTEAYYDNEIKQLGGKIIYISRTTSIKQLMKVIAKNGPYDVIHSHTLFNCGISNLAGKLAGIPIRIAHSHTTLDDSDSEIRKLYINVMRYLIKKTSTHFLACSQTAARYLFGSDMINSSKYKYLPNMINYECLLTPDQEHIEEFCERYKLENRFVIGHIGRMTEAKNHRFLIELIDDIKEIRKDAVLLLVGDGPLRTELEALVKEKQLEQYVIFSGLQQDVSNALYNMDVFVFPSLFEGLGLVLLEAQLCGIPCIVSEAIQPEADLGMNLMMKLPLELGGSAWGLEIVKRKDNIEVELELKRQALLNKGYTKNQIISCLMNIYQGGEI